MSSILEKLKGLYQPVIRWLTKHSDISHAIVAVLFVNCVSLLCGLFGFTSAHWIAAVFIAAYYWGREKRDHEIKVGGPIRENWYRGLIPKNKDFLYPLAAAFVCAVVIQLMKT